MGSKKSPKHLEAHTQYELTDGTIIPGVTTVLGLVAKPALAPWAWDLGRRGIDFRRYMEETAAIGRLSHKLALQAFGGGKPDLENYSKAQIEKAKNSLGSFRAWSKAHKVEPLMIETPLISEQYEYGGTLDVYGKVDGVLTLLDLKTAPAVYPDHWYQMAGYWALLHEAKKKVKHFRLLRIGRDESEGFDDLVKDNLFYEFNVFIAYLQIHKLLKNIKAGRSGFSQAELDRMKTRREK